MNNKFSNEVHEHGMIFYSPVDDKHKIILGTMINEIGKAHIIIGESIGSIGVYLKGKDSGVCFCPGCIQTLIISMQDLSNTLNDLSKMYNKAPDSEKPEIEL